MVRPGRLRAFRIVLLALATLIAVPASVVIRGVFFPTKLDVPSVTESSRTSAAPPAATSSSSNPLASSPKPTATKRELLRIE